MTLDREDIAAIAAEVVRLMRQAPQEVEPAPQPVRPPSPTPDMTEQERIRLRQEEGHYILATQGMAAYKKFWQEQSRKSRKPRMKRVA